ncbi:MAG: hypothetical protein DRR19_17205 [Candidatus Parabeggiatoa sp. nov. 1]|nr:MAG: hypothetical protein DRR19_17205 [Gammaproteobacteria bacterium]
MWLFTHLNEEPKAPSVRVIKAWSNAPVYINMHRRGVRLRFYPPTQGQRPWGILICTEGALVPF